MTIRYIANTTTGLDADGNGDLWYVRDGVVLSNSADAFDFLTFFSNDLVVEGTVLSQGDAIDSDDTGGQNTVHVTSSGVVFGASDGIEMSGNNHTIINHGEVTGLNDRGMQVIGDFGQITNTGLVYGQSDGISMEGNNGYLFNSGTVSSEFDGINISGTGNQVVNTGTVSGHRHGFEFNSLASEVNSLINSGTIMAIVTGETAVLGDFGDETVVNSGNLVGHVELRGGNDVYDGRGGAVLGEVRGGEGDDTYIVDDAAVAIVENAAEGTDEVQSTVDYNLGTNVENLILLGTADLRGRGNLESNDITGNAGNNIIRGFAGNDSLRGEDGDDLIYGGTGDDFLTGGEGMDRIYGDVGADFAYGGNGDDSILGEDGDDRLYGQGGNDVVLGGLGNDLMYGGTGNDLLEGGGGFDTLYGVGGNDTLTGDFNADRFVFEDGFGQDVITDFEATNNSEKIDLAAVTAIETFADLAANHMSQVGANVVIDAGGGNTITLQGVSLADLDANDFVF